MSNIALNRSLYQDTASQTSHSLCRRIPRISSVRLHTYPLLTLPRPRTRLLHDIAPRNRTTPSILGKAAPSTARRATQHPDRWARGAEALPPLRAIRPDSSRSCLTQFAAAGSCTRHRHRIAIGSLIEHAQYGTGKQDRKDDLSVVWEQPCFGPGRMQRINVAPVRNTLTRAQPAVFHASVSGARSRIHATIFHLLRSVCKHGKRNVILPEQEGRESMIREG
jgi:hypothetical protein